MLRWAAEALSKHPLRIEQYRGGNLDDIYVTPKHTEQLGTPPALDKDAATFTIRNLNHDSFKEVKPKKFTGVDHPIIKANVCKKRFLRAVEKMNDYFLNEGDEMQKYALLNSKQEEVEAIKNRIQKIKSRRRQLKQQKFQIPPLAKRMKRISSSNTLRAVMREQRLAKADGQQLRCENCKANLAGLECANIPLPMTEFCQEHIHFDHEQFLFEHCDASEDNFVRISDTLIYGLSGLFELEYIMDLNEELDDSDPYYEDGE